MSSALPPTIEARPQSSERRVAINSGLLLAAFAIQSVVSLVVVGLVARYLGQAGLGRYAYVISFIELVVVFIDLGMSRIQVRDAARDLPHAGRYSSAIFTLRVLLSAVLLAVLALAAASSGDPELWLAILVFGAAQALYLLGDVFGSIFQAHQRMVFQFWGLTLGQVFQLLLTVAVIGLDLGLVALFGARLAANAIALAYQWWVAERRFAHTRVAWSLVPASLEAAIRLPGRLWARLKGRPSTAPSSRWPEAALAWRMLVDSLPVGLSLVLRSYIWRGGVVLTVLWLGQAQGDLVNGVLYGPLRVVQQMRILPAAFAGAMLPVFSKRAAARPEQFDVAFVKSTKLFTAISLLLVLAFLFLADPIVILLLGEGVDLAGAAQVLRVLGLVTPLFFFNWLYGVTLVSQGRQRLETLGLALGLAAGFLFAWWAIPRLYAVGVSGAILVAEGVPFVIGTVAMWRHFQWQRTWPSLAKIVASCAVSGLVFALGNRLWTGEVAGTRAAFVQSSVLGALGLAAFLAALWLLRTFDEDERVAIRAMLRLGR
ncbi:MAG: oligosaccharide flippase family protein [Caldilineales bacterium]|nr:oligosaccharide flippase family protein [Caldilineales bacterium]MDW8317501.1 oligosaccharide flippase family protein [Anaerolineae bacterium]